MTDKIQTVKSLEVDDVKVYEAKGGRVSLLTKGKLDIHYVPDCDRFILRLNSFKYPLSVHVPILASHNEEAFRSYVLPNIGGHYVLKLKAAPTEAVLKNLETIFASYSQFSYKIEEEYDLENQHHRVPTYSVPSNEVHDEECDQENVLYYTPNKMQKLMKVGNYIKCGGEFVKEKAMKAANYVGKTLTHPKEEVASQCTSQFYVKTIEELKALNDSDNPIVDIAKYEISGLLMLSQEIEKYALIQIEKEKGFRLNPPAGPKAWPVFKKHAVDSAKSLWHGMDDALSNLSKTLKAKKTNKRYKSEDLLESHQVEQSEQNGPVHVSEPMQQIDANRYNYTENKAPSYTIQNRENMKQAHSYGSSGYDLPRGSANNHAAHTTIMGQISNKLMGVISGKIKIR